MFFGPSVGPTIEIARRGAWRTIRERAPAWRGKISGERSRAEHISDYQALSGRRKTGKSITKMLRSVVTAETSLADGKWNNCGRGRHCDRCFPPAG